MRRLMMRPFGPPHSPDVVANQEANMHRIVAGLLDNMRGKTRIDFVDEFACRLAITVICQILGVPLEDEPRFSCGEFVRRVENPRLVIDPPPYRHNQVFRDPRELLVDTDGIRD